MRIFKESKKEKTKLTKAIKSYYENLQEGSYDSISEYSQADWGWTNEDEKIYIINLLKSFYELLFLERFDVLNLEDNISKAVPVGLAQIVNLEATLRLMTHQKKARSGKENELNEIDCSLEVEAGLPGPTLAYLGALRCSPQNTLSKILYLGNVFVRLKHNKKQFGDLDNIVFNTAVYDYSELVKNLDEEDLIYYHQKKLIKYEKIKKQNPSNIQTLGQLNFLEKLVVHVWGKLNNDIGKFDFYEPSVSTNTSSLFGLEKRKNLEDLEEQDAKRYKSNMVPNEIKLTSSGE